MKLDELLGIGIIGVFFVLILVYAGKENGGRMDANSYQQMMEGQVRACVKRGGVPDIQHGKYDSSPIRRVNCIE